MKLRERYKVGFDRLMVASFVVVAATFLLIYLSVPAAYEAPAPDSAAGLAQARELEQTCSGPDNDPFAALCRDKVMAEWRWAYYRQSIDPLRTGLLWLAVFGGAGLFLGRWTWRWLREGFRSPPADG